MDEEAEQRTEWTLMTRKPNLGLQDKLGTTAIFHSSIPTCHAKVVAQTSDECSCGMYLGSWRQLVSVAGCAQASIDTGEYDSTVR